MRYIDPDLKDFLRREDSYTELAVEISAPDVGLVLRRATDQFFTAPPLVSPNPLTRMSQAARGGLQLTPTTATLASVTTGADAATFALNQENSATRVKGLLWTLNPAFTQAALRSFDATIQRTGIFKMAAVDFQLQIYRITKTPGTLQKYDATKNVYTSSALTQYAFTPLLSPGALAKAASIVWTGDTGALHFDLSQFGLVLDNSPTPAAAVDQVGELPVYFFVIAPIQPPSQNVFFWVLNTGGANVVANVGTFQRSWWSRANGDDTTPWTAANSADCPRFSLGIDTYDATDQATYLVDLGRVPTAGTLGRIVLEQIIPSGTSVTLELSTAGSAGPWAAVKSGDVVAAAQQQYWLRLTLTSDAAHRATPIAQGWGVEFRTVYDVSDIAVTQLPTRDVSPPDLTASIAEAAIRIIREGQQDFLDLATVIGSQKPTSKLEVDIYLRSRHPLIYGDRSKWLRLERLTVDDREPTRTSEALSLLSIAKKLKVKIPAQVESVNTVHTVTSATATAVQVTPVLPGTSVGGHEYNGLGYYARVRSSAAVTPGYSPTIAGSSGTGELDFAAGVFPTPLAAGDIIEVHSGLLTASVLKWQDADPADVWYAIFMAAGFAPERIGSADLPRSGYPPRVADFEPGDLTAQGKRKVTMQLTDPESADELLDQLSFIMGGATVERNGQMCFVQIYPGVSAAGAVTVPVAPVAAVFDARDIVAGSLRTVPMIASRKATVTATYGVNKAAANPDAYPERITNATDADAVEWLTQQDLETVGAMDLDEKVTRWYYNTADAGLYLATCNTTQVVRACSTGIRNFPFRVREPYPEVAIGDSVVVITDQYTDYDPSLGVAISGTVAISGVIVHTAAGGREFSIFVLGLSNNVQRIAGGLAGDASATDTAPDTPTLQLAFDANGHPMVQIQGAPGTLSMKVATSKVGPPTDADVDAAAVISGDQSSFTVAGLTCVSGETVYARAAAFSRDAALGARSNAATAARTRDTITPIAVGIIARAGSVRGNALLRYSASGGVAPIQLAVAYATVQNGATPAYGNVGVAAASPTYDDTVAPNDYETIIVYVQATDATGATSTKAHVIPPILSPLTSVGGQARPRRGAPFDDGNYAPRALDAGGLQLHVGVTDASSRTIAGMFHKPTETLGAIADDTGSGGYYKTNQNQRDGGGRAYQGFDGTANLVRQDGTGTVAIATLAGAMGSHPANMIVNGGGQDGTPLSLVPSWSVADAIVVAGTAKFGDRSILFSHPTANDTKIGQTFNATAGDVYRLGAWVKGNAIAGAGAGGIIMLAGSFALLDRVGLDPGNSGSGFWGTYPGQGTFDWTYVEITLLATATAAFTAYLSLGFFGTCTGDCYFDGVTLVKLPANVSTGGYRGSQALDSSNRLVSSKTQRLMGLASPRAYVVSTSTSTATTPLSSSGSLITIGAFDLVFGTQRISYSGGTCTAPAFGTPIYVWVDDTSASGGSVVYGCQRFQEYTALGEDRVFIGQITCVSGASGTGATGGGGAKPPV